MNKIVSAVVIGAGNRGGDTYGKYSLNNPDKIKIIAVAELDKIRRNKFAKEHNLKPEFVFKDWKELLNKEKLAETAIVTTQDKMHTEPAMEALKKGYDVLLEKPMATTLENCKKIVETAEKYNKKLQICHVLRYTAFFNKINETIESGKIGKIVNISLRENVSYYHYAHSFVRGNWHNREKSSPMILAKSCHDLDILYWLIKSNPVSISSFGSQTNFGEENSPGDAPYRCTDGCNHSDECLYYNKRIYVDNEPIIRALKKSGNEELIKKMDNYTGWPVNTITNDFSKEGILTALKAGPYGLCVYKVKDHDVVDHQVALIEFENNVTASFTMHGHSDEEGRSIRIDGTKGVIKGSFKSSGTYLVLSDSLTGKKEVILNEGIDLSGHGGGDSRMMDAFISMIRNGDEGPLTSGKASLVSHQLAFAIDKARLTKKVVNFSDF